MVENLAGPGDGPSPKPEDQVSLNKNISKHGAGAFQTIGEELPISKKTPTQKYQDKRFCQKK